MASWRSTENGFSKRTIYSHRSSLALLLVLAVTVNISNGAALGQDLEPLLHSATLDSHGKYVMSWTPGPDDIIIEVQVEALGYVGLGFSPTGGMKGADIVLGWVDDEGETHLTDRYATGNGSPLVDDSQDVTLISGHRNDTHTTLRFRRPWDTCDKEHDMPITSDTLRLIYAFNDDTPDPTSPLLPYHVTRGTRSLYLKEQVKTVPEAPEDVEFWDVLSPNISLPDHVSTVYWCKIYKLPKLEQKEHYIGFKPLIPEDRQAYVHHMILYGCYLANSTQHLDPHVESPGAQCHSPSMPKLWDFCNSPLVAWAVGSEGITLPDHVGIPLGEEWDGNTYFMLEIHYNNPQKVPGIVDASGLRMMHTKKLREYDGGYLSVGHAVTPFMVVPPQAEDWVTVGHCTSSCTEKTLRPEGINMIGGILHSHLLGTAITVQHIRDGKELPPILQDDHYDFNYQQERVMPTERTILPKDQLIVSCHYDTMHKVNPTYGGLSTQEEMCVVFLMYYPRQKLTRCTSLLQTKTLFKELGVEEVYSNKPILKAPAGGGDIAEILDVTPAEGEKKEEEPGKNSLEMTFYLNLAGIKLKKPFALQNQTLLGLLQERSLWGHGDVTTSLQKAVIEGPYEALCVTTETESFPVQTTLETYPEFEPYKPEETQCSASGNDETR